MDLLTSEEYFESGMLKLRAGDIAGALDSFNEVSFKHSDSINALIIAMLRDLHQKFDNYQANNTSSHRTKPVIRDAPSKKVAGISDLEKIRIIIEVDLKGKIKDSETVSGTNKIKIKKIYHDKYKMEIADNKFRSYLTILGYTKRRS